MTELEILQWIQSFGSLACDFVFIAITMTAEALPFLLCIWMYWCGDKQKGTSMGCLLFVSIVLGNMIKDIFQLPRPLGEQGIQSHRTETATGYSFPSQHTQTASTFAYVLAKMKNKLYLYGVATIYVALVGLSRLYLGVHYPKDVLAGAVLGCAVAVFGLGFLKSERCQNKKMLVLGLCLSAGLLFAESADYYKALGGFWGFYLGIQVEQRWAGFSIPTETRKKWFRYVLGLATLGILYGVGKWILPSGNFYDMLRYGSISLFGMGIYPLLLVYIEGKNK